MFGSNRGIALTSVLEFALGILTILFILSNSCLVSAIFGSNPISPSPASHPTKPSILKPSTPFWPMLRRDSQTRLQGLQSDISRLGKEIGKLRAQKHDSTALKAEVKSLADEI